jgi:hypothetical protein
MQAVDNRGRQTRNEKWHRDGIANDQVIALDWRDEKQTIKKQVVR